MDLLDPRLLLLVLLDRSVSPVQEVSLDLLALLDHKGFQGQLDLLDQRLLSLDLLVQLVSLDHPVPRHHKAFQDQVDSLDQLVSLDHKVFQGQLDLLDPRLLLLVLPGLHLLLLDLLDLLQQLLVLPGLLQQS